MAEATITQTVDKMDDETLERELRFALLATDHSDPASVRWLDALREAKAAKAS